MVNWITLSIIIGNIYSSLFTEIYGIETGRVYHVTCKSAYQLNKVSNLFSPYQQHLLTQICLPKPVWVVGDGVFFWPMLWYWIKVDSYLISFLVPVYFMKLDSITTCDKYFQSSSAVIKEVNHFPPFSYEDFFCWRYGCYLHEQYIVDFLNNI